MRRTLDAVGTEGRAGRLYFFRFSARELGADRLEGTRPGTTGKTKTKQSSRPQKAPHLRMSRGRMQGLTAQAEGGFEKSCDADRKSSPAQGERGEKLAPAEWSRGRPDRRGRSAGFRGQRDFSEQITGKEQTRPARVQPPLSTSSCESTLLTHSIPVSALLGGHRGPQPGS